MPIANVNGVNLYYESYGKGEPLVLITGYAADHGTWLNILEKLAKTYNVIIFDNRGSGQSSVPVDPYFIDVMTEDTKALCDFLQIQSAYFVGFSMGGMILQDLIRKYPAYVKRAVFNNTMMKTDIRFLLAAEAQLKFLEMNAPMEALIRNILPWLFSSHFLNQPRMVDNLIKIFSENPHPITALGLRNQLNAIMHFDSSAWIQEISKPCLVLGADEDQIVQQSVLHEMTKCITGASFYSFKRVGHMPSLEMPEEYIEVVTKFLGMTLSKH